MKTALLPAVLATADGREADAILRACVHCGLCTATCPTYQLLGNELDSPRGRIYLIKEALEGGEVSKITLNHLDRCLTCQACETTCPSGVNYHRLLDTGRAYVENAVGRAWTGRLARLLVRAAMTRRGRFALLLTLGQWFRPLLPGAIKSLVPIKRPVASPVPQNQPRQVILFQGCVQPGLSPQTNRAATRVLNRLGIGAQTIKAENCCGALSYHSGAREEGLRFARANIDAWVPVLEQGAECLVFTASGCSNFVQDYAHLLAGDPEYVDRAEQVVKAMRDVSEVLDSEDLSGLELRPAPATVLHCPCTLQHGQNLATTTKSVLQRSGFQLPGVRDEHECCGSAGAYSIFNSEIAGQLRDKKLVALSESEPDLIVTANIGCQTHLASRSSKPVRHWIEALADRLIDKD
ncbi:MAG: glycolate oxidase iron-sulfur subunit [Halieaceae bacterium]